MILLQLTTFDLVQHVPEEKFGQVIIIFTYKSYMR